MTEPIPDRVLDELEQIRAEGPVNMMDRRGVQAEANIRGMYTLVCWIEDNQRRYMEALMAMGQRRSA